MQIPPRFMAATPTSRILVVLRLLYETHGPVYFSDGSTSYLLDQQKLRELGSRLLTRSLLIGVFEQLVVTQDVVGAVALCRLCQENGIYIPSSSGLLLGSSFNDLVTLVV